MCTIHILKCPSCNAITSANRHTCPLTPATQVCHANHTNYITTYFLPGGCTPCLTRVGPYHTLPAGAAFVVPPWQRSSFSNDSLVSTTRRSERYLARLRMLRKSLETRARRGGVIFGGGPMKSVRAKEIDRKNRIAASADGKHATAFVMK
ncbi:hypothetical protein CcaCcLH18_08201 [Colletotrichum camelliae]|nr:hypothetical protein CcaCcLH18_08201 [Colletotrichum camelliae]